jgi:hypothetical protein
LLLSIGLTLKLSGRSTTLNHAFNVQGNCFFDVCLSFLDRVAEGMATGQCGDVRVKRVFIGFDNDCELVNLHLDILQIHAVTHAEQVSAGSKFVYLAMIA